MGLMIVEAESALRWILEVTLRLTLTVAAGAPEFLLSVRISEVEECSKSGSANRGARRASSAFSCSHVTEEDRRH